MHEFRRDYELCMCHKVIAVHKVTVNFLLQMIMSVSLAELTVNRHVLTHLEAMNAVVSVATREMQQMEVLVKVSNKYLIACKSNCTIYYLHNIVN